MTINGNMRNSLTYGNATSSKVQKQVNQVEKQVNHKEMTIRPQKGDNNIKTSDNNSTQIP